MDENEAEKMTEIIYEGLHRVYDEYGVPDEELEYLAEQLYDAVFEYERPLNEILSIAYTFEEEMRADGIKIDVGCQCLVFDRILNYLEHNKKNAKRLYDSFTGYCNLKSFDLLMTDYEDLLTKEQRAEVLKIGKESFIKPVWEDYE